MALKIVILVLRIYQSVDFLEHLIRIIHMLSTLLDFFLNFQEILLSLIPKISLSLETQWFIPSYQSCVSLGLLKSSCFIEGLFSSRSQPIWLFSFDLLSIRELADSFLILLDHLKNFDEYEFLVVKVFHENLNGIRLPQNILIIM